MSRIRVMDGQAPRCPARSRDLDRPDDLPVRPVVLPPGSDPQSFVIEEEAYAGDGTAFNSDFLNGLPVEEAKAAVIRRLEELGRGEGQVQYRLRDWGVSRQRYWGCPIPVIHCPSCGVVPLPREQLPLRLPEDVTFDHPGNPSSSSDLEAYELSVMRRRRRARHRHDGYLRGLFLVLCPLLQSAEQRSAAGS